MPENPHEYSTPEDGICARIAQVRARMDAAARHFGRPPSAIGLVAVAKTWPAAAIRAAWRCGQRRFGENYAHELAEKSRQLADLDVEWHFIGHLQSNKSRLVAHTAAWVHSIDRLEIAQRLSRERGDSRPPLQVCVQVNVSAEASKSGVSPDQALPLLHMIADLPNLRLRGLMTLPAPAPDFEAQRAAFAQVRTLFETARDEGLPLDTLSMGMSDDLEAAIAEGATLVRVGTAIFGPRRSRE